ncbi:ExeA family protein [Teredinibacter franksiae]|uniref:ExeA family protein n=1 Tax=Teredinibacter franksiae TaxID=2761453 RepID=UPI001626F468|nr:ExeA family protein [Teredinibacter franksiae]
MYHNYFGLKEQAFSIAVNPRYLYMSQQHKEALAHLLYGVKGGGFVLLSGEVGTGKTTIIKCLLEQLPDNTDIAIVLNPMADVTNMLSTICEELGAEYDNSKINVKDLTDSLYQYLLNNHTNGHNTVLLIDEAQLLSPEALEQIRLLTNLETTTQKLLQIILVGQPELNELLAQPRMRQLSQRITARFHLVPLSLQETHHYIAHRLQVAGMPEGRNPYPQAMVRKIHRFTGGVPRLINIVCERMLIGAYGHNKPIVDIQIFKLACSEVVGSMEHLPVKRTPLQTTLLAAGAGAVGVLVLTLLTWAFWPKANPAAVETALSKTASEAPTTEQLSVSKPIAALLETENDTDPTHARQFGDTRDYNVDNYTEAQFRLFTYLGFNPSAEKHPCWELANEQIQCKTVSLDTWESLAELNRPAVLVLRTPERFTSHAVITGIGRREAQVVTENGESLRIPLAELGPLWTGKAFYTWKKPEGFSEPIVQGMRSRTVKWVAEQFATLDQREQPLTGSNFTRLLQQRVKIFQRSHGLKDDGIIGEQTLMKINEVLGFDKPLNSLDDL